MESGKDVSFSTIIRVLRALNKVSSLNIVFSELQIQLEDLFRLKKERKPANKKSSPKMDLTQKGYRTEKGVGR